MVNEVSDLGIADAFGDVFEDRLGKVKGFEHRVKRKENVRAVQQKVRRLPLATRDEVFKEIKKLENSDVIEQIEASEWVSAMVVVTKRDGRVRLCVDLRAVNEAIVADVFPLPHFEDLLTRLSGATVFSKLDALSAYHQVELAESSRDLTAFITPWGLYRFKRVPFGLASAPAAFQRMMEKILEGIEGVVIYLDDILVCAKSKGQHDDRLRRVLERFREVGMVLNKKCVIGTNRVEFVGYTIGPEGVRPNFDNLRAIEGLREPTNATQIKSVLGTASFYMRCVPNFSTIAEPMRRLLKAEAKFEWGPEQKESFDSLKRAIVEAKPLAVFDFTKEIVVACDASNVGLGATLLQCYEDGERPVSFASCALSEAQQKYSTGEKEALACVFAVEKWHVFLFGRKFKLRTDHQSLTTLLGTTGVGRAPMRIARWVERLRGYNFVMEYRPGISNNVPDMLSRLPTSDKFTTDSEDEHVVASLRAAAEPLSWEEIATRSETDKELGRVREWLRAIKPRISERQWSSVIHELSERDGVIMRAEKIVLPESLRSKAIELAHEAHQGMVRTKQRLRQIYWWPSMDRNVEEIIKQCAICIHSDRTAKPGVAPIESTPWPTEPWERLAVDIRGPDGSMGLSSRFAVVVIDYYSKWADVEFMQEVSGERVVDMFRRLFRRDGLPKCIVSDNGSQFIGKEFSAMIAELRLRHAKCPVFHAASNGLVERFNRTLGGFIATARLEGGRIRDKVLAMVATYNATPQATTGKSPAELLHGRRMRTRLDVVGSPAAATHDNETRQRVTCKQQSQENYAHRRRAPDDTSFESGEWVRAKRVQWRKGESRYFPPTRIEKRIGQSTYRTSDGRMWHRDSLVRFEAANDIRDREPEIEVEAERQPEQSVFTGLESFSEGEEEGSENDPELTIQQQDASDEDAYLTTEEEETSQSTPGRPQRNRRMPERFGDFVTR